MFETCSNLTRNLLLKTKFEFRVVKLELTLAKLVKSFRLRLTWVSTWKLEFELGWEFSKLLFFKSKLELVMVNSNLC